MKKSTSYDQIGIPSGGYRSGSKSPSKTSKRSVRRKKRGFVSLEVSSPKHRRAKIAN